MKTKTRTVAVITTTAFLAAGVGLSASALTDSTTPADAGTTTMSASLPDGVAERLQLTREEERMTRDLYAALAKTHDDARPMSKITKSEDRHFDAVGNLLDRYGVSDPAAGRSAGSYAFPEIQKLYDAWYAKGKASVNAAHKVGVEVEKWDIAALEKETAKTSQTDVKRLYTNLLTASEHHLSAYEAAVSGKSLEPGNGNGNGWRGKGNGMNSGGMGSGGQGQSQGQGQGHGPGQGERGDCPMVDDDE